MRSITVDLGERSYPIYIGSGLLQSIGERCTEAGFAQRSPLLVVSDTEVAPRYLEQVETSLRSSGYTVVSHVIQAGEASKSLAVYEEVITTAIQGGLDRSSAVLALGGESLAIWPASLLHLICGESGSCRFQRPYSPMTAV